MTGPAGQTPKGRSPGMIIALLAAILLTCGGLIAWDQTRDQGPTHTDPAPASNQASGTSSDGFGGLK